MTDRITLDVANVKLQIQAWLREDIGPGDVSSLSILPEGHQSRAVIHAKAAGIVAGLTVAEAVFAEVDRSLAVRRVAREGSAIKQGDVLLELEGSTLSILTGERLALNLLQRMSGIATVTREYVSQLEGLAS